MAAWKDFAKKVKVDSRWMALQLKEKNRRIAVMNRLRTVIRCEERAAEKEYLALGRYYYNALRSADNAIAESHCARIDAINARRDSALESLEQAAREAEASVVAVAGEADGSTAVYTTSTKKKGQLFHFDHGPIEITVTRDDDVYDPDDEDSEEVDLSDVACYDSDPEQAPPAPAEDKPVEPESREVEPEQGGSTYKSKFATLKFGRADTERNAPEFSGAELTENDSLPFE